MGTSRKAGQLVTLKPDANLEPRVAIPHISFSQLSTYTRCSMQYFYAYVMGIRSKPSLALVVGSGGHSALEYNGRHKIKTGQDLAVPDMLDMASTFIEYEQQELDADAATKDEKGEAKDRALASLRVYQTRDAPNINPAGVEVEFNLDLNTYYNEEPIRIINGKIDLITTDTGIIDYKFVGKARSQNEVDISPQLTLYGKVFHTLTGKYPSHAGYQMFLPGSTRTPADSRGILRDPDLMKPQVQETRFKRLQFQFQQVEKAIRTGIFIPTDNPMTCAWCGYRDRCQSSLTNDIEAAQIRSH